LDDFLIEEKVKQAGGNVKKGVFPLCRGQHMSKRKKEIKKRKKVLVGGDRQDESLQEKGPIPLLEGSGDAGPGKPAQAEYPGTIPPAEDSHIVAAPVARKSTHKKDMERGPSGTKTEADSWSGRNKENLLLGLLIFYVLLLGLGTVGELFEIEWILNLPLFR